MKFVIRKTSDYEYKEIETIKTLEELMDFIDKNGSVVIEDIIDDHPYKTIEIYDTYRE